MAQPSTTDDIGVEAEPSTPLTWVANDRGAVTARSMASGVVMNYIGVFVVSAAGFFLTPYLIRELGATAYGVMALSVSMINYAGLLDFGIGLSVMKLIADRVHQVDQTETRKIVSTVLALYTLVGIAIVVGALFLFGAISGSFHVPDGQQYAFHVTYVLAALTIGITFPQSVFSAVVTGHRDFGLQTRITLFSTLASMAGTVWLVWRGHGIISVATFNFEIAVLQFIAKIVIVRRRYNIGFARRHVDLKVLPQVLAFASWVFVINVASKVIFDTDTIVIGALLGPAAVAVYQVALSPNVVLRRFGEQFNVVALTGASSLQAQGDDAAVKRLFLESTRIAAVIMLPFAIVFGAWGGEFVRLWVGDGFHQADKALLYLSLAMIAIAIQGTASQVIMAYSRHRVMAIATTCEAIANLTLSIVLGKHYGITGVAAGTLLPTLVTAFCVSMPYAARLTSCSLGDVLVRFLPPVLGAAAIAVVAHELAGPGTFGSMFELIGAGIVVFVGFVAANILLFGRERATYLAMLSRAVAPVRARLAR